MRKYILLLPCLFGMGLSSCSDVNSLLEDNSSEGKIVISIDKFTPAVDTRTNCDPNNNYSITWAAEDVIGIFPFEGDQEPFTIPADQVGESKLMFDGGYWTLKDGKTYNAYYPFSRDNYASSDMKTMIPVTYIGQSQKGSSCNVGAFDYTYSDWVTSTAESKVHFAFHHLGSFLVLHLPIQKTDDYISLTLEADNSVIPTTGHYDLTSTAPHFITETTESSLSMSLDYSGVQGEVATFYMMVPPMDLTEESVTVVLSSKLNHFTYSIDVHNILPSKKYEYTCGYYQEEYGYVDLGLPSGTLWATCNVGARKPYEYGWYFAWGETIGYGKDPSDGHLFDWANYKWCNGSSDSMTKYCTQSWYGTVDNKLSLDDADDAARANWGDDWRMPTMDEVFELRDRCTVKEIELNGVKGCELTGPNGNTIFLPYTGVRSDDKIFAEGVESQYLTSTYADDLNYGHSLQVTSGYITWYQSIRSSGYPVRAVRVTGNNVVPTMHNGHEYVDLGITVDGKKLLWATTNVGASKDYEVGDYFAWGETEPYYEQQYYYYDPCPSWRTIDGRTITGYNWESYKWCEGNSSSLTKYCYQTSYGYNGFTDGKMVLDPEDDAAHVNWGGEWRMPTYEEFQLLKDNCTWTFVPESDNNGFSRKAGVKISNKSDSSKFIFLPIRGNRSDDTIFRGNEAGYYWTSSLYPLFSDQAYRLNIESWMQSFFNTSRYIGQPVRPVCLLSE